MPTLEYVGTIRQLVEKINKRDVVTLSLDFNRYLVEIHAKTLDEAYISLGKRLLQDAGFRYVDLTK